MHFGIALVAILHAAKVAAVGFGVFEESDEVGHADDIDGATDAIAVKSGNGQGHVTAVTSAGDGDAVRIQLGLSADPIEKRVDVFVGVFAQKTIIQKRERLCRSPSSRARWDR